MEPRKGSGCTPHGSRAGQAMENFLENCKQNELTEQNSKGVCVLSPDQHRLCSTSALLNK